MAKFFQRLRYAVTHRRWLRYMSAFLNQTTELFLLKYPAEVVEHIAKNCSSRGLDAMVLLRRTSSCRLSWVAISSKGECNSPLGLVTLQGLSTWLPEVF